MFLGGLVIVATLHIHLMLGLLATAVHTSRLQFISANYLGFSSVLLLTNDIYADK